MIVHQKKRGKEQRGAETRQKLLDAALELFGTRGFHGTTVRNIAEAADANVSAVAYHFGGKEGLYLDVARFLGETVGAAFAEMAEDIATQLAAIGDDKTAARRLLSETMQRFVRHVIRTRGNDAVIGFVMGEQLRPTEAFPILYESGMRQFQENLAAIVAVVHDCARDDEQSIFIASTLFGQAISFGVGHTMLLARLQQNALTDKAVDRIAAIIGETTIGSLIQMSKTPAESV